MTDKNFDDVDFYKLDDKLEEDLEKIWKNVFIPYIRLSDEYKLLNLKENDLDKFKNFYKDNSRYYKLIQNNLHN